MSTSFRPPWGLPREPMRQPGATGYSSGICSAQIPDDEKLPHQLYPYTFPPPTFQSLRPTGVIDLPAVGDTTTIMSYTVPLGWDAVIVRIGHDFIGTGVGFTEGSGQLIWQINLNTNQPIPNYGAMTTTVGAVKNLEDISPGFVVKSGQTIYYRVNNVSLVAGGTKVFAGIGGYQWRNQDGAISGA